MKKFVIQGIVLLVVLFGALMLSFGKVDLPFIPQIPKSSTLLINNNQINIDVADNQSKRALGLSGRESLATDSGMLFLFDTPKKYQFWMKGMKFPLDFIWIRNKKVVDVLEKIPSPTEEQKDETLPVYESIVDIDSVLEVNSGYVNAHNIKVGDSIEFK